jgi:hypothetical protein
MSPNVKFKIKVQAFVTGVFAIVSIYLIITEPANSDKIKWAYGTVGIIFGYWLK